MSELSALKNAARMADRTKQVTRTGKVVDLSKGYTVRAPDGTAIPFKPSTPLEKAKEWTKNFYNKNFEFIDAAKPADDGTPGASWTQTEEFSMLRDKTDKHTYLQFADLGTSYRIQMSFIPQSKRGKGVGAGMYRALFERAKKDGMKVQSDSHMSEESIAIWRRFKELGYPIKENEIVPPGADYHPTMYSRKDGGPLFEYDPGNVQEPAILRKQAGAAPGDEDIEATGALLKPQAGEKRMSKMEPGLYFDEDSKQYVQVGEDGSMKPAELNEAR